jgi:voltage-gated potassium channel Kch
VRSKFSNRYTLRQRATYWFDTFMASGTLGLIVGLAAVSTAVIFLAALIIHLGGIALEGEDVPGIAEAAWMSLMRTMDAGTIGGDTGYGFRAVMLVVTLIGIFIFSTLIGILSSGLEAKLDSLRQGRSKVLETDHTLILGWSPKIFMIISELYVANESRDNGAVIVILADRDKVEMENELRARLPLKSNTRVVCRSGLPTNVTDLEIVSPQSARSIIVLAEGDKSDVNTAKIVLAVTHSPYRRVDPYHIVTQIDDAEMQSVLTMISRKDKIQSIVSTDLIARVMAQTSRQSGLSIVVTELLDFGGAEIYFKEEPALVGSSFGEALNAYPNSAVMGLKSATGGVCMNPPMETVVKSGDLIFAIAEDDHYFNYAPQAQDVIDEKAIKINRIDPQRRAEHVLILGWNRSGVKLINELDQYVGPDSEITIFSKYAELGATINDLLNSLNHQTVSINEGDICDRALLSSLNIEKYDHIIVLAYRDIEEDEADGITLLTLLHLRDIAEQQALALPVVSEMLNLTNRDLASATKVDDFIVSDHLIGLMMSQISENSDLLEVFSDLFDADGSEIYLKPIENYVDVRKPLNFYTLVEAARRRGECAIGFRIRAESDRPESAFGVCVNPSKSKLVQFDAQDEVIVLASS